MTPPPPAPRSSGETEVSLGYVSGVFGWQGELRLFLYNPASDLLFTERDVVLVSEGGARRPARLCARHGAGKRVLGRVVGVETEAAANVLVGAQILVPRASLPPPEPDTWYHHEILGLPVRTESGRELGHVAEISSAGEIDVWIVRGPDGEHYIPARKALLKVVDTQTGVVVADEAGLGAL